MKTRLKIWSSKGIIVTPAEVETEYRKRNEKIKIDYIGFDPQDGRPT